MTLINDTKLCITAKTLCIVPPLNIQIFYYICLKLIIFFYKIRTKYIPIYYYINSGRNSYF